MNQINHHWGSQIVDISEKSLPSLKVGYLLRAVQDKDNISILEIGSGEGKILKTLEYYIPNLKLFGCDIKEPKTKGDYRFKLITDKTLPYENESFDMVAIIDCLEHVPHYKKYLQEIYRVLKKEGVFHCFVVCEGELISMYSFYRLLFGKDLFYHTKDHVNSFTKEGLIKEISQYFIIKELNYSYHLLGHLMDATLFMLTINKKIANLFWNKNRYYNDNKDQGIAGKILNVVLTIANGIAYYESRLLKNVRLGAHGMHISCVRK